MQLYRTQAHVELFLKGCRAQLRHFRKIKYANRIRNAIRCSENAVSRQDAKKGKNLAASHLGVPFSSFVVLPSMLPNPKKRLKHSMIIFRISFTAVRSTGKGVMNHALTAWTL
jgi:hypothetical protein